MSQTETADNALPVPVTSSAEEAAAQTAREKRLVLCASRRMSGVHCVLDGLENAGNRAAVLRSVEALGLLHVHEVAPKHENPNQPNRAGKGRGVAHGGEKWLMMHRHDTASSCRAALDGVRLLAALPPESEMPVSVSWHSLGNRRRRKRGQGDDDAVEEPMAPPAAPPPPLPACLAAPVALEDIDFSQPVALAFGNERLGLSAELLAMCDGAFHIPLFGFTESLNVSVAVAISMHHARLSRTAALRASGALNAHDGDGDAEAVRALMAEYQGRGKHYFAKGDGGDAVEAAPEHAK